MEHNVVSLKTAEKLREAGFRQDTMLCWEEFEGDAYETPYGPLVHDGISFNNNYDAEKPDDNPLAAPTAQEIADELRVVMQ